MYTVLLEECTHVYERRRKKAGDYRNRCVRLGGYGFRSFTLLKRKVEGNPKLYTLQRQNGICFIHRHFISHNSYILRAEYFP